MIWSRRKPSKARLDEIRECQATLALTYAEHGASLGALPAGYHSSRRTLAAGSGAEAFAFGRDAIRTWSAQRALGMELSPEEPPLAVGSTMAFALQVQPPLPLWVTGCCRIVCAVDDPRRFGFAYGTLPNHPECGEEVFLVHHRADDSVEFEITQFSRPASALVRLAGPLGRWLQHRSQLRYLEGYRRFVVAGIDGNSPSGTAH